MLRLAILVPLLVTANARAESRCGKWHDLVPPHTSVSLCTPIEMTELPSKSNPDQITSWLGNVDPALGLDVTVIHGDHAIGPEGAKRVLDNAVERDVNKAKGTVTSRKDVTLGKHPGRDIVYTTDSIAMPGRWVVHGRFYSVDDIVIHVIVLRNAKSKWSAADETRFLDSLRVEPKR